MGQRIRPLARVAGAFHYTKVAPRLCLKGCRSWGIGSACSCSRELKREEKEETGSVNCNHGDLLGTWPSPWPLKKIKKNKIKWMGGEKWGTHFLTALLCRGFVFVLSSCAGAARQENLTWSASTVWCSGCRDEADCRKTFLSVPYLWRLISSCWHGLLTLIFLLSRLNK